MLCLSQEPDPRHQSQVSGGAEPNWPRCPSFKPDGTDACAARQRDVDGVGPLLPCGLAVYLKRQGRGNEKQTSRCEYTSAAAWTLMDAEETALRGGGV